MEPPTMLTKADRNTRVMVNTPTRVLFILDRTIFLESVCSGAGKSCPGAEGGRERRNRIQWTPHTATEEAEEALPLFVCCQQNPECFPDPPPCV